MGSASKTVARATIVRHRPAFLKQKELWSFIEYQPVVT
jgi:hypothetical protein